MFERSRRRDKSTFSSVQENPVDSGTSSKVHNFIVPQTKGNLRSGALAKATGVSPDTIRHYERIGVLPRAPRTESGYRVYPPSAVERVQVVQRALRVGFSLAELADVLKARDAGGAPCHRVYQLASAKLKGIAEEIEALKTTERYLKKVLNDWQHRMRYAKSGQRSHLLYSLTEGTRKSDETPEKFRRRRK
jgi:DNA-binding transcriptional MerR regulator